MKTIRKHIGMPGLAAAALMGVAFVLWSAPSVHGQGPITKTAAFAAGDTISDKTYTAGTDVNLKHTYTGAHDQGLPSLPEVAVTFSVDEGEGYYEVDYTAADLPAGISLANDRVLRGIPESATSGAVTVTYTATVTFYTLDQNTEKPNEEFDEAGTDTASLTFEVTVNPPVTWSAQAQKFFNSNVIAWVPNRGWRNATFPEAQGGSGTLTYSLIDNNTGQPLANVVAPLTFNASTRTLGGTLPEGARYAVTYIATDENGAAAQGYTLVRHGVGGL